MAFISFNSILKSLTFGQKNQNFCLFFVFSFRNWKIIWCAAHSFPVLFFRVLWVEKKDTFQVNFSTLSIISSCNDVVKTENTQNLDSFSQIFRKTIECSENNQLFYLLLKFRENKANRIVNFLLDKIPWNHRNGWNNLLLLCNFFSTKTNHSFFFLAKISWNQRILFVWLLRICRFPSFH